MSHEKNVCLKQLQTLENAIRYLMTTSPTDIGNVYACMILCHAHNLLYFDTLETVVKN